MATVPYVESAVEGLEYDLLSLFQPCLEDSNPYPELIFYWLPLGRSLERFKLKYSRYDGTMDPLSPLGEKEPGCAAIV